MNLAPYYDTLSFVHLSTIIPAFVIGTYTMLTKKGSPRHKILGRVYMLLMLFTALVTLFMPAQVGPTVFSHFGLIHLLSLLVLYSIPVAHHAAKTGNIARHRMIMVNIYVGALLVAGGFTLVPGRLLGDLIFG